MSNALGPNLTTPFPLLNMPQPGKVPDKLMSALNLKQIIKENTSSQLYKNGSKLQNGHIGAAAKVIYNGQLAWENKTHLGNRFEVNDTELFALMDRLRYLVRIWDDKSPIMTLYTMVDNLAVLEGAATGDRPSRHQWAYRAHAYAPELKHQVVQIYFIWSLGHSDVYRNDIADKLEGEAALNPNRANTTFNV
jgi:ribonuclease HI